VIQEPFAIGGSPLHQTDPRLKIILATAYSFLVAVLQGFPALLTALVLSIALVAIARLDSRALFRRLGLANGLILFLWLLLPFTFPGKPLASIGPFALSLEGVRFCAQITLKSNAIILALIALVATSPIATLGYALHRLHVPAKMVLLLLLTYRYLFVLEQEYERLARAMRMRGFRPQTSLHTYRTYAYLVGMLFVRASARAERVHQAMLCRGFTGRFRTLKTFTLARRDWIWPFAAGCAMSGLIMLEWTTGWH